MIPVIKITTSGHGIINALYSKLETNLAPSVIGALMIEDHRQRLELSENPKGGKIPDITAATKKQKAEKGYDRRPLIATTQLMQSVKKVNESKTKTTVYVDPKRINLTFSKGMLSGFKAKERKSDSTNIDILNKQKSFGREWFGVSKRFVLTMRQRMELLARKNGK